MRNSVLSVDGGLLTLSSYSRELVASHYRGLPRIKPADYFGVDHRDLTVRYRLSLHDTEALFTRVTKAYQYYWPGKLGRFSCYEDNSITPASADLQSVFTGLNLMSTGKVDPPTCGVHVEATQCATFLHRYLRSYAANVQDIVCPQVPAHAQGSFYLFPVSTLGSLDWIAARRQTESTVCIHHSETQELSLSFTDCVKSYNLMGAKPIDKESISVAPWEWLSLSVEIAHLARLSAELRGPISETSIAYAGGLLALLSPLVSALKKRCRVQNILCGFDGISFSVDSAYLSESLKLLYDFKFFLSKPLHQTTSFGGINTPFDAMFDMRAHGDAETIMHADYKALRKGKIL